MFSPIQRRPSDQNAIPSEERTDSVPGQGDTLSVNLQIPTKVVRLLELSPNIFRQESFEDFHVDVLGEFSARRKALTAELEGSPELLADTLAQLHKQFHDILRSSPYFTKVAHGSDGTEYLMTDLKQAVKVTPDGFEYLDALLPISRDHAAVLFESFERFQQHQWHGFQIDHLPSYEQGVPVEIRGFDVSYREAKRTLIDRHSEPGHLLIRNATFISVEHLYPGAYPVEILSENSPACRRLHQAIPIYYLDSLSAIPLAALRPEYLAQGFVTSDGETLQGSVLALYDHVSRSVICQDFDKIRRERLYGTTHFYEAIAEEFVERYRALRVQGLSTESLLDDFDRASSSYGIRIFRSSTGSLALARQSIQPSQVFQNPNNQLFDFEVAPHLSRVRASIESSGLVSRQICARIFDGVMREEDWLDLKRLATCSGIEPSKRIAFTDLAYVLNVAYLFRRLEMESPGVSFFYLGLEEPQFLSRASQGADVNSAVLSLPCEGFEPSRSPVFRKIVAGLFGHYVAYCDVARIVSQVHTDFMRAFATLGLEERWMSRTLARVVLSAINRQLCLRHEQEEPLAPHLPEGLLEDIVDVSLECFDKTFSTHNDKLLFLASQGKIELVVFLMNNRKDLISPEILECARLNDARGVLELYGY